jgi:diacylglycerol kinase family enzyme
LLLVILVAVAALAGTVIAGLVSDPLWLPVAIVCLAIAISAAFVAITRTATRRLVFGVVALLAFAAPLVIAVVYAQLLYVLLAIAIVTVGTVAARHAFGRDIKSLKRGPTPGLRVGPATRPVLLMNPKSGGGKVERFHLVEEAKRHGIEPVLLAPGDDLLQLAEQAVDRGADALGMAGGDGSQALVAGVAMRRDVGFVCVPAGTRNHLAMDLGLDRSDVAGALDAFGDAVERRIDLGLIGNRVFVNNATIGLYAKIVQSPAYREHKVGTALELLPEMLGPDTAPLDLRFSGPDGTEYERAHLIMVSNNRYALSRAEGFGSRPRIDAGTLGVVAAHFKSTGDLAQFVRMRRSPGELRDSGWTEWTATSFEVQSDDPIEIGIDGEAMVMDAPIRFRIVPRALRVRIPSNAPGHSPAAGMPTSARSAMGALVRTAAGLPPVEP